MTRALPILGLALLLTGCCQTLDTLHGERNNYYVNLDLVASQTMTTTRIPVTYAQGQTLYVAVHEFRHPHATRTLVFIHGLASDSRAWRFVCGALQDYDIITIDLPGCGQSDAPDPATAGDLYSLTGLARSTLQALQTQLAGRPGVPITLDGHSLGGAAILRMYGDPQLRSQFAPLLQRVDSLVLFAPADLNITQVPPAVEQIRKLGDLTVALGLSLGLLPEAAAQGELNSVYYPEAAKRTDALRMLEILSDAPRRHALQAMIREAFPVRHTPAGDVLDQEEAQKWIARYAAVDVPCLILWGMCDPVLSVNTGHMFSATLPHAQLRILDCAKHSLHVEHPALCARLIRDFLNHTLPSTPTAIIPARSPLAPSSQAVALHDTTVKKNWTGR
jgi:2-hydroxy-6-oxonona-2,4-dienedioate hydrolase